MEFRDLAYFQVIADEGHVGRAAQRLGRTQPALSKCIQRMQDEIGAKLFARSGRGIQLTAVGKVLLERSRSLHLDLQDSMRMVSDFAEGRAGHIRIGTGATTAEYLLPQVLSSLIAKAPDVTFEIVVGMNDVLRTALMEGEVDLVVGPLGRGDEESFATHPFGEDVVVVVASEDHPLAGRAVTLADLAPWNWVMSADSVATRQWLDSVFAAHGAPLPRVQMQTNNISLMPRLIARTKLLSFISQRNLGVGRAGEPLVELRSKELEMRRALGLIHRRDRYLPPAAELLIEIMRSEAEHALSD
jgi:DNA-binding transcriptional LysR family regulator